MSRRDQWPRRQVGQGILAEVVVGGRSPLMGLALLWAHAAGLAVPSQKEGESDMKSEQ